MSNPTPLRRELLSSFGVLFAGAILVAGLGVLAVLPVLGSQAEGMLFIVILVVVDLVVHLDIWVVEEVQADISVEEQPLHLHHHSLLL